MRRLRVTKRTVSVTVKMKEEDWGLLAKAAEAIWPGAPVSRSSIMLGLAKREAENVLGLKRKEKKA